MSRRYRKKVRWTKPRGAAIRMRLTAEENATCADCGLWFQEPPGYDGSYALTANCIDAKGKPNRTTLDIDHIVPMRHGGTNDYSNLRLLCGTCNGRKGARYDPAEAQRISDEVAGWRSQLEDMYRHIDELNRSRMGGAGE